MSAEVLLEGRGLVRRRGESVVINGISLSLAAGEAVALMGPSGCGKTTLLHLLGLLDRPSGGTLVIEGIDPWRTSAGRRAGLRLRRMGFVFQQSNLLPFLTARENVALPAWRLTGDHRGSLREADALLERFGLAARAHTRGGVLSLGEAQRVATARALVNRPAIILADEPSGSLDSTSTKTVLESFDEIVKQGTSLLVATHDQRVADRMQRTIRMHDGRIEPTEPSESSPPGSPPPLAAAR